jgi:hypothetical protein
MMSGSVIKAPDITRKLFGGIFDVDGSGHYPGLELINLVVCCEEGTLPTTEKVHVLRVAHDFARRLIADSDMPASKVADVLMNEHTTHTITHLLKCLELEVPNVVGSKSWERTHFFPYTRSLVHWDARRPKGEKNETKPPLLERRYYRGAGAYAFSVLRHDPDHARLKSLREGFDNLYPQGRHSPLEQLALTLKKQGHSDTNASFDTIEIRSELHNDSWEDLFRDGMRNVLSHRGLPTVQRVRAVMNWTSIWIALMESARAFFLRKPQKPARLVVDCAGTHPQLRRAAQRCFKDVVTVIEQVSRDEGEQRGTLSAQQLGKIRAFYGNTAAAGGLLNAWRGGHRYFTLRLPAIETMVLAAVPSGTEVEFDRFLTEWLFERCGVIAGREGASRSGMLKEFDGTIFEENERRLADQMRSAGMLKVFSDATRMVHAGGRW